MITQNSPAVQVWLTIQRRPDLRSGADFRRSLERGGFKVSEKAHDLLGQQSFIVTTRVSPLDFARCSNADLGRPDGCTLEETYRLGVAAGLELCVPEDGAYLRLNLRDEPQLEGLIMAMPAMVDCFDGDLLVFGLIHNNVGRWLTVYPGSPDSSYAGRAEFIFRRPRNT